MAERSYDAVWGMSAHRSREVAEACATLRGSMTLTKIGRLFQVPRRKLEAMMRAWDQGGSKAVLRAPSTTGRPPLCDWPARDVQAIREVYLHTNRGEEIGSMSMAVRICKHQKKLSDESQALLSRPASTKHYIPSSLRKELQISPAVRQHHRHPRNATLGGAWIAGTTRLTDDGTRRLLYGERISFDDGSQNQIVCVPWPWGGTPEADRFGIRTMRGQWLAAHCDGTSTIPAWVFTLRPRDSYRDQDAMGLVFRMCRDIVLPDEVVCEGGVWQSKRARAFYQAAGVNVRSAKGRPHLKLIENWWNRAWTFLSHYPDGQIGRFRGEMQRENDVLVKCRKGQADGRKHFIMLPDLLREFEACVAFLDQDPIESTQFGRWIPAERRAIDMQQNPRGTLQEDLLPFAAPEAHVVTVRRQGVVLCKTFCPLGIPHEYEFMDPALTNLEGQEVRVLYDPFEPIVRAAILAERSSKDFAAGALVCMSTCVNPPPAPIAEHGWLVERDGYGLSAAGATKKAMHAGVITEYRGIRGNGAVTAMSETREPGGAVLRVESGAGVADGVKVSITGAHQEAVAALRRDDATEAEVAALEKEHAAEIGIFG